MINWSNYPYSPSQLKYTRTAVDELKRAKSIAGRPKIDLSKLKIDISKSKFIQRANSRVAKGNKRIEKFEIKKAKAQYINDKKTLAQHDLGVVQLVFGIIFAMFLKVNNKTY